MFEIYINYNKKTSFGIIDLILANYNLNNLIYSLTILYFLKIIKIFCTNHYFNTKLLISYSISI